MLAPLSSMNGESRFAAIGYLFFDSEKSDPALGGLFDGHSGHRVWKPCSELSAMALSGPYCERPSD